MQEQEPAYQAVARRALEFLDRAYAQGIQENRDYQTVIQFLTEIAKGEQEVREIIQQESDDG